MKARHDAPSVWQDLNALAGLYRNVFTLMTRRVLYGSDWPGSSFSPRLDAAAPPPARREERELAGSASR